MIVVAKCSTTTTSSDCFFYYRQVPLYWHIGMMVVAGLIGTLLFVKIDVETRKKESKWAVGKEQEAAADMEQAETVDAKRRQSDSNSSSDGEEGGKVEADAI